MGETDMRAIVVESTANIRTYVKKSLESSRLFDEIFEQDTGVEFLQMIRRDRDIPSVAFVDWSLKDMSGTAVARLLKDYSEHCSLVFLVRDEKSALKVMEEDIAPMLRMPLQQEKLRNLAERLISEKKTAIPKPRVRISTFGYFNIYVDGKVIVFNNLRAKELLAMMVNSCGGVLTMGNIIENFWSDESFTPQHKTIYRKALYSLRNTLREYGIDDIIISRRNQKAIRVDGIDCDYFHFIEGDREAIASYDGDYMMEYSWAEVTNGKLWRMKKNYDENRGKFLAVV